MKRFFAAAVLAVSTITFVGCASSHEEGVKSNLLSQWAEVNASVAETTDAAKAVFEDEGLKEIKAASTKVDGKASGKKADGTDITATVGWDKEKSVSTVTVKVGMTGDSGLGAELARKIKTKAEGT